MPSAVKPVSSLRTRYMLFALALVTLFSLCWGSWTWMHERQLLRQRLEDAGTVLGSSMAIPIINALLYEELGLVSEGGLLDNFIVDIMENPQLRPVYALVIDSRGEILAHSQLNLFGEVLDDPLSKRALSATTVILQQHLWQNQQILDVGSPLAIHGKRWGSLRIGLPLAPLEAQLQALTLRIVSFSCLFALGALTLFFVAGGSLVRPLRELTQLMEQVNGEQLAKIIPSRRRDELGLLHNSFAQMLVRLRRSEAERDKGVRLLLENERLVTAGRIVAGVAHEINNPLAGIQGALFTLQNKPQSLDLYLPLLQEEVARISGIVTQLLDLSRAGELDTEPIDSEVFLRNALRICHLAIKGKQIDLRLVENAPRTVILGDANKIQQVMLNLVINAVDAMQGVGKIQIRTCLEREHFCFQVSDTGPGIPEPLQPQVFTPFFTTKPAGKGTGIGLAFCLSTIERHGGTLRLLKNDAASGACFEIRLPLEDRVKNAQ